MSTFTPQDFQAMKAYYASGATRSYHFRKQQLLLLKKVIMQNEDAIADALYKDLHKSKEESFITEIGFMYSEISHSLKNLKQWMEPQQVDSPLVIFPSKSKIVRDPLGVCLIIAPWNYPFMLLMSPLVGAIAGGNCSVLKPSELTPHTSQVIHKIVSENFDKEFIRVVEGDGAAVVPQMMNENRFDHVFFTGSISVGKSIAKMAAEKLVSTTLELGGKSPCIVDGDADITVAAKRITWGKFTNAGQTCVAPDYLLVHEKRKDQLIEELKKSIHQFYGKDPQQSLDYGRIINSKRFDTLLQLMQSGNIIEGGKSDKEQLYIAPTLMKNVTLDDAVMKEEIFGPVLPIISYKQNDEALNIIKHNPNPLSLYYFGNNKKGQELFLDNLEFGGGCINNTLVHLGNLELPFGGVGNSGIGSYHGKFSFDTFTRAKSIVKTGTWIDPAAKYPPYKGKLNLLKWFLK